ncbi:MAG: 2-amino-4-hydroxy-6-hydroxymethyldihydropteridine diphosphokinase [Kistimonas sp.]|nr:2-amino-4-hydroxy-6-hydroxymethyldihydropteridine diphosphokinase [Kistimonas sp.]
MTRPGFSKQDGLLAGGLLDREGALPVMLPRVYIGLGSNLGDPVRNLQSAVAQIAALRGVSLYAMSRMYKSKPVGPQDQPDYVNAVISLETSLSPLKLLDHLQAIERAHGRRRTRYWGERTLDLDMLLYGDRIIEDARLNVPHPQAKNRNFVLRPLADIEPNLVFPAGERLRDLVTAAGNAGLSELAAGLEQVSGGSFDPCDLSGK